MTTKQALALALLGTLFPGGNQTTQTHTWTQNSSKPNVHSENTIVPESGAWILRSTSLRSRFRGGLHLNKLIVHFENTVVLESGQPHCLSHSPQRLATAIYFPTTSHQLRHFLVLYSLFVQFLIILVHFLWLVITQQVSSSRLDSSKTCLLK